MVIGEPRGSGSLAVGSDELFVAVYDRLKAMAGKRLAAKSPETLNTTALVHELYLRMSSASPGTFAHPSQFFAYAARAMRHLLMDRARHRLRERAGGGWMGITLTGADQRLAIESAEQALELDQALERLAAADARALQVVELVHFAGLTLEQTAETLGLSRRTVDRDWRFARAFLRTALD